MFVIASAKPGGLDVSCFLGKGDERDRTVVSRRVLEAAGVVERFVPHQSVVGLHDDRVLVPVVLAAVAVQPDLQGECVHQVAACR